MARKPSIETQLREARRQLNRLEAANWSLKAKCAELDGANKRLFVDLQRAEQRIDQLIAALGERAPKGEGHG